ncbi:DUF2007 domain-containing protein [Verrucomicrobiaceae bacterium 5K15]|uniref:DUF2007 domain-containing protein n=1 Tax=Oceaniferula flava TaxID=2800421 RepID=A0AAE2S9B4_9BACT|nr:DUF2007 domain-containing protein [Oceaniferula flavus]MBK1853561.1 DUF2007 domain-containing protein [Oceaniferula flavus]MBM1134866.1 DUF2007 domain-containing protein [Oceaniferula flavus]
MIEIYRAKDFSIVAYYRSILEAEGIPVMLRNEHLTGSGLTEIPIPEFYPNICVMHDEDYPRAREILQRTMVANAENSEKEVSCPSCGESNPGNFEFCFSCGEDLTASS